jgi:hypothetical protein
VWRRVDKLFELQLPVWLLGINTLPSIKSGKRTADGRQARAGAATNIDFLLMQDSLVRVSDWSVSRCRKPIRQALQITRRRAEKLSLSLDDSLRKSSPCNLEILLRDRKDGL